MEVTNTNNLEKALAKTQADVEATLKTAVSVVNSLKNSA